MATLGRGVSNLGSALAQIAQAEGTSQFATARAQSNKRIQEFELETKAINDPSIFGAGLQAAIEEMEAFRPKSSIGSKMFDDFLAEQTPAWEAGVEVLRFNKIKEIAVGADIANFAAAIANIDPDLAREQTEESRATGVISNEQAAKRILTIPGLIDGVIQKKIKQGQMDLAVTNPEFVKTAVTLELKARKAGDKGIDEFTLLTNTDLEDIRDYAGTVGEKKTTDSAIAVDTATEDNYSKIIKGETDISSMIAAIQADPVISEDDSIKAADKIVTFFSKWNSLEKTESTKDSAIISMEDAVTDLTEGRITKANYFETYADNKKDLNETDRQRYLREAAPAYGKMIANVKQVAGRAARARIISKTEADLLDIRQKVDRKELPSYILGAATIKNQAESINYSNYEFSVLDHFSADENKNSTQKQTIDSLGGLGEVWASKDWIETYRNYKATSTELSTLTRDISAVYNSAVNNIRKRGRQKELKNPWEELDDSKQARIIDMMSNGATIEDVMRSARQGNL